MKQRKAQGVSELKERPSEAPKYMIDEIDQPLSEFKDELKKSINELEEMI